MNTLPKITSVCQIEKKKKVKKYLTLSWKEFCEILRKIECGELRLPSGGSLADDIESALKEFISAKYGFKVKLVTEKQKAALKHTAEQILLEKVRALKLRQFIEKEKRFPSDLELDKYQDYCYEASLSPLCERQAIFYNVLTKKRLPYRCGRLRCGCNECAEFAMLTRQKRVLAILEKNDGLDRMITVTLDQKRLPGGSLDEKRKEAWNKVSDSATRLKKKIRYYLKKHYHIESKDLHFITWFEPHKLNQFPHAHILLDEFIEYRKLKELAAQCGFGIVHIERWTKGSKSKIAKYTAKYTSKQVSDSPNNNDDDGEKYFDRRALLYVLPRKRLITYSRNCKITENTGLCAWSIVEGKSDNLIASELAENVDSKEYPIYPSAYTNTLIGLWNYIAGGTVKVKPSVAKIVEKAREANDKTILLNLAKELSRCGYLVSPDQIKIITDTPALREINAILDYIVCGEKAKFHKSMASDKYLQFRPNMDA